MTDKTIERVVDTARWIFAWQSSGGLKDAQMIRRYPGLGSARTYRALRGGEVDGYDVERWQSELSMIKSEIEAADNRGKAEEVFSDLSTVVTLRRACLDAMATNGSNRVVIAQGGSGSGKSFALRALREMYGSRIIVVEAVDAWNDKPGQLLAEILIQCGAGSTPRSPTACFKAVVARLKRSRVMLAIDEAHHMGPHCINTIKALVNQTPGEFLLLAMGTLWDKLETTAYQEAAQIAKNRLSERVVYELDVKDVGRYIRYRCEGIAKDDLGRVAVAVKQAADDNGNLSFVRDVCDKAAEMVDADGVYTLEVIMEAVGAVTAKRSRRKQG